MKTILKVAVFILKKRRHVCYLVLKKLEAVDNIPVALHLTQVVSLQVIDSYTIVAVPYIWS